MLIARRLNQSLRSLTGSCSSVRTHTRTLTHNHSSYCNRIIRLTIVSQLGTEVAKKYLGNRDFNSLFRTVQEGDPWTGKLRQVPERKKEKINKHKNVRCKLQNTHFCFVCRKIGVTHFSTKHFAIYQITLQSKLQSLKEMLPSMNISNYLGFVLIVSFF